MTSITTYNCSIACISSCQQIKTAARTRFRCHSVIDFLWLLIKNWQRYPNRAVNLFLTVPHLELVDPVIYACWFLGKTPSLKSSQCSMVEVRVLAVKVLISMQKCCGVLSPNCLSLEDHFNPDWLDFLVSFQDTILNWSCFMENKNADEGAKESKVEEEAAPAAAGAEEAKPWRSNWVCSTTSVTTHDIQLD